MSQKSQGNPQSKREGADKGYPGRTEKVSEVEKVGGTSGVRFPVHDHPDHSVVERRPGKLP